MKVHERVRYTPADIYRCLVSLLVQSCEVWDKEDKTLINAFSIYVCSHPFDRRGNSAKIMVYLDIKGGRGDSFCVEMFFAGSDMEMDEVSLLPVVC